MNKKNQKVSSPKSPSATTKKIERKAVVVAKATVVKNDSMIEARPGQGRVIRKDGWNNVLTGIGVKGKDKRLGGDFMWHRLDEITAEHLYAADKIARKIVDLPIDEALKKGWTVKLKNPEDVTKVNKRAQDLDLFNLFPQTCKMASLYGGAGMVVNNGDILLDKPITNISKLLSLTPLNRWELYAMWEDIQKNILYPGYGKPSRYTLQPRGSIENNFVKIHASRVIRFEGAWLPQQLFRDNQYWGDSVLNGLISSIRDYQLSNDSVALMVQDFCVAVFKIKDLADKMAADGDEEVIARMQLVDLTRSIARAVVVDAEGEDFTHQSRNVSGINDLLDKVEGRLVSQTPFPHTVLFGNSPSGMGGTGNHEQSNWYDHLEAWQENYALPILIQIYKMICEELNIDPSTLEIEFPPLFSLDESQVATTRKTVAETDQIYKDMGVISSEEIAKNRFSGDKYSMETKVDMNSIEPDAEIDLNPEPVI